MRKYLTFKNIFLLTTFLVVFIVSLIVTKPHNVESKTEEKIVYVENKAEEVPISFSVDVKGAVKNPGVYDFNEGEMIVDAIKKAGGLLKSSTTKNINLSKKLKSEMVVYIFTTAEIKKKKIQNPIIPKLPECICETIEINNCPEKINDEPTIIESKEQKENEHEESIKNRSVNLNKSSLEELQTLPGIGLSKAQAIIKYREETPFVTIEDLMNVSGIGEKSFEKLKDLITIDES